MRLTDLDPQWIVLEGKRVGFTFVSPKNAAWRQSCLVTQIPRRDQMQLLGENVQMCASNTQWQIEGGIDNADFSKISVTPSLDGSAGGLWHGHITNGEIVGGI